MKKLNKRQKHFLERDPLKITDWEDFAFRSICAPGIRIFCRFFARRGRFKVSYPGRLSKKVFKATIQKDLPIIFYSNHLAWPDTIFEPVAIDELGFRQYGVLKIELFKYPVIGKFFWIIGGRPIVRETSQGFRNIMKLIKAGKPVTIWPQGTRAKKQGKTPPIQKGAALLAVSAPEVVLISLKISGSDKFPRSKIKVSFGIPRLSSSIGRRENRKQEILEHMAEKIVR